jgi:hypothetical protein
MPAPMIPFPDAPVGEWVAIRTDTAAGLFAYRHLQAVRLLDIPDYGGGDLTHEQRREARNLLRRLRAARTVEPDDVERRFLEKVFETDRVTGWKEIAHFLGLEESAVRTAYKSSAEVRREIYKTGGRYWSTPGALMNVVALF